jgi:diacylglycerol kinase family enzyme
VTHRPEVTGLLVLLNRAAGTADDEAVQAVLAQLRTGADVEVAVTGDEDELREALAGRGERRPVVVGGDGSAHAAVCALDRLGALDAAEPFGLVARGTGNDLARALGLPLDPVAGARAVLSGVPRPLDLVRDDAGGLVLNAVHAGIGARAYAEAKRVKAALKTLAFPLGALVAGVVERSHRLRVEVDGRVVVHERAGWAADGSTPVLLFAVSNGPTLGGGRPFAPSARLDDGLAEVLVCRASGPAGRAGFAADLLRGRHVRRDDVVVARGREVTFSGPPVRLDADGELQDAVNCRSWRVDPAAWSVLVPG